MSELNENATRKAPEAELAESVAECVRLTKQTVSDIRAIRRAYSESTCALGFDTGASWEEIARAEKELREH